MQYLSAEPPFVEVEVEEKNEKGRVINTIYKMVQEEGPRQGADGTRNLKRLVKRRAGDSWEVVDHVTRKVRPADSDSDDDDGGGVGF